MQKDVKSAGRGEALRTTANPIPIGNSTEVLKVGDPRTTLTVSHLYLETSNLTDKQLHLDTKEEVNTKKVKEKQSSKQPSLSSPIADTISEPSPKWLKSDVHSLKQPPVSINTTISMSDKSTSFDPFRRLLAKSDNGNDVVSKPKQISSDVKYVQPKHIIQFNTDGKVQKKVRISDLLDRDFNRTGATTVNTLDTKPIEEKISGQGLQNNNQTINISKNQNYVQRKPTKDKQHYKQKKEEQGSLPIRRFNRGNVTARATPVEKIESVPTKASGQLKALNQESTSGRNLVPSIVNVDYFFFFLNHSTDKEEIIKGSKTSNKLGTITSVNGIHFSNNTQMQLNVSKQQRLAVTEQIKRSHDMLDLLYESKLWRVSFFDNRSILNSNKKFLGSQQTGSLKDTSMVGKAHVHSEPQVSSLEDFSKTNSIYTTQTTAYSTTVIEISSEGNVGNRSYLSMTSPHRESNSNVNDTNQTEVYNEKKYATNQAALKRQEPITELRELYVEGESMSTIKPNYDMKIGNQIGNSIGKEFVSRTINSTSHPDRSSNTTNLMNDTEMHSYSGKSEILNITLTELPPVIDASKSYADTLNWIQSTIETNDASTRVISTPTGVTSTSYSETSVWPKSTVGTFERTTIRDKGLTEEMFVYEDHLRRLDASSTLDSAMGAESNETKITPNPIVGNYQAKSANSMQGTAQSKHQGTIVDMILRDAMMSYSRTTPYPYSAARTKERTTWGSDLNADMLMYLQFIRTLNEI
ncbi:hypothetical protein ACJMK2_024234 [Sinanodonta woodiana]|uniref:Uncharacterized protein n=1 Tax=Sinanodonta woodiana TaxID=1069815 RepID=A0ABD3T856_SINWO